MGLLIQFISVSESPGSTFHGRYNDWCIREKQIMSVYDDNIVEERPTSTNVVAIQILLITVLS